MHSPWECIILGVYREQLLRGVRDLLMLPFGSVPYRSRWIYWRGKKGSQNSRQVDGEKQLSCVTYCAESAWRECPFTRQDAGIRKRIRRLAGMDSRRPILVTVKHEAQITWSRRHGLSYLRSDARKGDRGPN